MMKKTVLTLCLVAGVANAMMLNPDMKNYINELKVQASKDDASFKDFDALRGEKIYFTKNAGKDAQILSCQSCHNADLSTNGINVFTNKTLDPLSPKANASRLTNVKDVKKWLKRNFKDVFLREGTAKEKGDVLYYIMTK